MKRIDPKDIEGNFIKKIGEQWMLVTAGAREDFNTMTASWGGAGMLWNKPVAFVFIRPQRYTHVFTEREECMTLSFFGTEHKKALQICGSRSGRDHDKVAQAGLTPIRTPGGLVSFRQASLVLECRKLYAHGLESKEFIDKQIILDHYPAMDFHTMYIVEITGAWVAE